MDVLSTSELISIIEGFPIMYGYQFKTQQVITSVMNHAESLLPLLTISMTGHFIIQPAQTPRAAGSENCLTTVRYDGLVGDLHLVIMAIYDGVVDGGEHFEGEHTWYRGRPIAVYDFDRGVEPVRVIRIFGYPRVLVPV